MSSPRATTISPHVRIPAREKPAERKSTSTFFDLAILATFIIALQVLCVYKIALTASNNSAFMIRGYVLLTGLFLTSRFFIVIFYKDDHRKIHPLSAYPTISFVIAAKNEDESIFRTIMTCMKSDYPAPMECIAVDDGSDDRTREEMQKAASWFSYRSAWRRVSVIVFDKNRGKREAMAEGVHKAMGDIIVFVDSDSFVKPDAVKHIVEHFLEDQAIGAVSGNSGVENAHVNALTKMQSARYGISFDVFKACESVFGLVTCCPGCFSAYRRTALLPILDTWRNQMFMGTRSTFGDDRSLTNYVLRSWKVIYCQTALATTIVPHTYMKFLKQQLRWKKSWIREGLNAASFVWKKNVIASCSFYANLLLPIFSPFIVFNAFFVQPVFFDHLPYVFVAGVLAMSSVYGNFIYWQTGNRYSWYIMPFTAMYTSIMVWQMPYALFKLRDTRWGTR